MSYRSLIAVPLFIFVVGCSSEPNFDAAYERITLGTLQAGSLIPEATGEPIITVTGNIGAVQDGEAPTTSENDNRIVMDQTRLNAVGMVEYAVEDPFERKHNTFRGVLFRDLLDLWQVPPEAERLVMTALNDYEVNVPISMLREYPVLLAQQQNGQVMTRDYRGPAMLVTPLTQYPSVKDLAYQDYWIWQIKTIHVE